MDRFTGNLHNRGYFNKYKKNINRSREKEQGFDKNDIYAVIRQCKENILQLNSKGLLQFEKVD